MALGDGEVGEVVGAVRRERGKVGGKDGKGKGREGKREMVSRRERLR